MRRLFLLILVMLVPLRGLAGDLMPITMGPERGAIHEAAAMPADCAMQHAAADGTHESDEPMSASCCDTCALCFSFTAFASLDLRVAELERSSQVASRDRAFQSSEPAPALKPPIS